MESKYNYDIIRDYLHGLVDADTARKIRELISTDEVARNIAAGILQLEHEFNGDENEIEAYIEQLRQKQLKLIGEKGKTRMITPTWVKLAAAILIIAIAAPVIWLTVFRSDSILEKELSEPYPLATLDRSTSGGSAFEYYINHEYKKAIIAFDELPVDANAIFYKGLSSLYAGDYTQAATILSSDVLQASRYREQAEWFKTLALIKDGEKIEAIDLLKKISGNTSHYKSSQALALLEELE